MSCELTSGHPSAAVRLPQPPAATSRANGSNVYRINYKSLLIAARLSCATNNIDGSSYLAINNNTLLLAVCGLCSGEMNSEATRIATRRATAHARERTSLAALQMRCLVLIITSSDVAQSITNHTTAITINAAVVLSDEKSTTSHDHRHLEKCPLITV